MVIPGRYEASGREAEFEPGSRGRVLRNRLGIVRVRDIEQAESEALLAAQNELLDHYTLTHRFTAEDIRAMHGRWLGASMAGLASIAA
jgi:cell filamentation protein